MMSTTMTLKAMRWQGCLTTLDLNVKFLTLEALKIEAICSKQKPTLMKKSLYAENELLKTWMVKLTVQDMDLTTSSSNEGTAVV